MKGYTIGSVKISNKNINFVVDYDIANSIEIKPY